MLRVLTVNLLLAGMLLVGLPAGSAELDAPDGWGGETIQLPPGFAADMKLTGKEQIRFAPGMMQPQSDSFFCYAFVFELPIQPALTEAVIKAEFLKYYRGLCKAVLGGQRPDVDPSTFTFELKRVADGGERSSIEEKPDSEAPARFEAALDWVEPFATGKPQRLNLEIWAWRHNGRNYLFACVSPQQTDSRIWTQLRAIRNRFLEAQTK